MIETHMVLLAVTWSEGKTLPGSTASPLPLAVSCAASPPVGKAGLSGPLPPPELRVPSSLPVDTWFCFPLPHGVFQLSQR